ncbi:MAG: hypothetical protein M3N21_08915 [Actinomycetota bacterium]|nr:hypothetical protein [Actinomycetota bacterium]
MRPVLVPAFTLVLALAGCASNGPTGAVKAHTVRSASPAASPKYADQPGAAAATAPCAGKVTPNASVAAKLPQGFPVLAGWTGTEAVTQGKTTAVRGVVAGAPGAIVTDRDTVFTQIKAAGYQVTGSDQEPGFEADGDFTGPHPGNINVKLLCQGHLLVTYTFTA